MLITILRCLERHTFQASLYYSIGIPMLFDRQGKLC